jgi:predicted acetyltransferase
MPKSAIHTSTLPFAAIVTEFSRHLSKLFLVRRHETRSAAMPVEVRLAQNGTRERIDSMMEHYLADLGAAGATYPHLDAYWQDSTRHPYMIHYGEQIVGFALVHRISEDPSYDLVEFYIAAEFRNRGFGRKAVETLFKLHPGTWSVAVRCDNATGQAFWASVLSNYASVATAELKSPQGVMYTFPSKVTS